MVVWSLLPHVLAGEQPERAVIDVVPGLALAFKIEPLGMLFALVAASLWVVNSIYSIGYMRANTEPRQTSFYVCFAVAIGATMGIAFAGNLFTLFLFYELLTLSTYPLVTHKANARGGARRTRLPDAADRHLDAAAAAGHRRHRVSRPAPSTSRPAASSPARPGPRRWRSSTRCSSSASPRRR